VEVCTKNNVKTGTASILCCVDGQVEEYEIEIQRVNYFSMEANKGLVIKVVDEKLLEITGGIVQGMGLSYNWTNTGKPHKMGVS
jgi:stage IV sporulation protein B